MLSERALPVAVRYQLVLIRLLIVLNAQLKITNSSRLLEPMKMYAHNETTRLRGANTSFAYNTSQKMTALVVREVVEANCFVADHPNPKSTKRFT
jgi:hypothetical protein